MPIELPKLSLVVLVGASGSGKSTFARTHFAPTEVLSSDTMRGWVADDENDQSASKDAFDVLEYVAGKRLAAGRLTVVDATNVRAEFRRPLVRLARDHHVLPVAIVLDVPERVCRDRNEGRADRELGPHVVRRQRGDLRRSLKGLRREGFRHVHVLRSVEEVDAAAVTRVPLWTDRSELHGPFDLIGDVHGCADELQALLTELGYSAADGIYAHPAGRTAVFVGDLVDRGPKVAGVLRTVGAMINAGSALCVAGNHDDKLLRILRGKKGQVRHGLQESLDSLEAAGKEARARAIDLLDSLRSHVVLDGGALVVAHAGLPEHMHGRASGAVRSFALYGDVDGSTDEHGLPVRRDWAADYRGSARVVYGHTPVAAARWRNNTINLDTGCCFGGRLTALRYPEMDVVSVPAAREYAEPSRPLPKLGDETRDDGLLDLRDVMETRSVETTLRGRVTVRAENAAAALEVMGRFAADPRWLPYLPPTMSPPPVSVREEFLEHPDEAIADYARAGVRRLICEEKHMGSRTVLTVCQNEEAAARRFGDDSGRLGAVVTRTGRPFFNDETIESALLERVRTAVGQAGLWAELETDWLVLDAELMPWSAKAQALLKDQYAAVGAAGRAALPAAVDVLRRVAARDDLTDPGATAVLLQKTESRSKNIDRYVDAYRHYCWPVHSIDDYRLAPFHVLAARGRTFLEKDHLWHMNTLSRLAEADPLIMATRHRLVDTSEPASVDAAVAWWDELTASGGEGMVLKPLEFVARGGRGDLLQPAVKCRGREYLRIIYGPDYLEAEHLKRLKKRGLKTKRSMALREFALGVEALDRLAAGEPLHRIHECVFAVLALESEPVDPRL